MNKNTNLFLAVAIWLGCMLALYTFFPGVVGAKKQPSHQAPAEAAAPTPAPAPQPAPDGTAAAPRPTDVPRGTQARPPTRLVTFETPRARVVVTSDGAAVQSVQLLGSKWTQHKGSGEEAQVDLVGVRAGEALPYSTLVKGAAEQVLVPADTGYQLLRQDATSAAFRAEQGGLTITKTLSVDPQTYAIRLGVEVRSSAPVSGQLAVLEGTHALEPAGGLFSPHTNTPARAICLAAGNKVERMAVGAKTPIWEGQGAQFAGLDEQYFLTAVMPPAGVPATCRLEAKGEKSGSLTSFLLVPLQIPAGGTAQLAFTGYAGPKTDSELTPVGAPLKHSIEWGFWSVIAEVLLAIMKFFHGVVPGHNWGVAIILLTVAMKLLTFPLQHKSMKSMQEMQRIQPQLEEMKKKYAGDTQRQNVEQMKLFKEHGVNPMGSCLPMLIQMPIWFALYTTLQVSVELYNEPFIPAWIGDLTSKDPYYVLPVAMGITMILTQVLTPAPMSNPSQKTMGYVMSGFFSLLMLTLPSGLTLYIFTNNILSIAQQMYLRRTLKKPPASGQTIEVQKKKGGGPDSQRAKQPA